MNLEGESCGKTSYFQKVHKRVPTPYEEAEALAAATAEAHTEVAKLVGCSCPFWFASSTLHVDFIVDRRKNKRKKDAVKAIYSLLGELKKQRRTLRSVRKRHNRPRLHGRRVTRGSRARREVESSALARAHRGGDPGLERVRVVQRLRGGRRRRG